MTQSLSPSPDPPPSSNLQGETHRISRAVGMIGAATFCSRVLGFLRDIILANLFGANAAADAFYIAYRIPNLLRELFAEGSMSSAFIPIFTEYHSTRTKQETWELASATFTTLLTLVTFVTLLGILGAPTLVWLLAPGLHHDAAQLARTTLLTQVMFPYLLFVSLAALAMGILNALRSFAIPALAPVFFNVCVIVFALAISPLFREPILAVALGIVVGGLAQFLMQLPGLHKKGFVLSWNFHPTHPGVKRMGVLLIPTLVGLAVTQVNLTVSTILASYFDGGPTYLFYAMRLIQFPLGIFGVAVATAILPSLSTHAAEGARNDLRSTVNFGLRMVFFIMLPSMAGLILLRIPIIHLFFEHGAFSANDTLGTASALLGFSVGLWAFAIYRVLAMAFYSLQDTRTPATIAIISVVINIAFSLWLMGPLAHAGLALATGLAAICHAVILASILGKRLEGLLWGTLGRSLVRTGIALVPVVGLCMWIAAFPLWQEAGQGGYKFAWLSLGIAGSMVGYLGVHFLLRSDELTHLRLMFQRRLPTPAPQ